VGPGSAANQPARSALSITCSVATSSQGESPAVKVASKGHLLVVPRKSQRTAASTPLRSPVCGPLLFKPPHQPLVSVSYVFVYCGVDERFIATLKANYCLRMISSTRLVISGT